MNGILGANWLILTPIVLLSVLGIAVIIERVMYFRKIRPRSGNTVEHILRDLPNLGFSFVDSAFDPGDESPAREMLEFASSSSLKGVPQLYRQRLEALRDRYLDRMERNLGILPGIGNLATLMGLFGTVSGMISAFTRMNETGNSDPYILAGGISRALVTTAAGLAVAIPVLLAHHLLEAVVDRHAEQLEEVVTECVAASGAKYARKRESKKIEA